MRLLVLLQIFIVAIGSDVGELPGHMQPIGSHRPPEDIYTLSYVPDPIEFYEDFMIMQRPALFKGAIAGTPAVTKWIDDEYLSDSFGEAEVGYEIGKKEDRSGSGNFSTLADFLKRYKEEDIYLVNDMPMVMQKEWQVPRCLLCGGYTDNLNFCYIWFSSGGTKSVLHTDSYENLHCLASGIKEFVLIHPDYANIIGPEHKELGYYHIDVERVNMTSHPGMMEVPWYYVRVESGDCLYLPYNWIHHVSSHGRNLGVNIWWGNFRFRRDKCPKNMDDVPNFMPLSEFNLHPGKQIVSVFVDLARDDGYVYAEDLAAEKLSMYDLETVRQILEILDPGCGGKLLISKMVDNEITEEAYDNLKEFIDFLSSQQALNDLPAEWVDLSGEESTTTEGFIDDQAEEDEIEVPSREDVEKFLKQHHKAKHNEL